VVSIFNQLISLIAQYNQVPNLLSTRPLILSPERQEMHMRIQKLEVSGPVLATVENLLDAFQLAQNFLLQITECWPTFPPQLHFSLSHR
jgi:hypothetical protein